MIALPGLMFSLLEKALFGQEQDAVRNESLIFAMVTVVLRAREATRTDPARQSLLLRGVDQFDGRIWGHPSSTEVVPGYSDEGPEDQLQQLEEAER